MSDTNAEASREGLRQSLRADFDHHLEARIDRYLEVNHHQIIPFHHFAEASAQCLDLYRDGYFIVCIMATQAVCEGIVKLVAERNEITRQEDETREEQINRMVSSNLLSDEARQAALQIHRSFRNDYHHMNPCIATLDHCALAKRNIMDLANVEREVFAFTRGAGGAIRPQNILYWDVNEDGESRVNVRFQ